ncbi:MAG: beta-N-acetylhexosaminidase [Myxococcaceae bacterium]
MRVTWAMQWLCLAALCCAAAPPAKRAADVERVLSALSLEQKVGQLMMVGFAGTEVDEGIVALLQDMHVGGVCLFKRNVTNADQVAKLNAGIQSAMKDEVAPFIAVDQEGGNVVRVQEGAVVLPGNMALGATRSKQLAHDAGKALGLSLRQLGFNMNLAPVLDVNVNPKNPVIGIRSLSDQPELVTELGAELVRGQQEANIVTVAKHFPGHGNTDADSHRLLPVMKETERELLAQIAPFTHVIGQGLDGVMTAHVSVPEVSGDDLPATLSPELLQRLLRGTLHFDGLVITDELEMEAIAQRFGVGNAATRAIQAGADMVLIPWRPEKKVEVHQALLSAARSGAISNERLNEAVKRILTLKLTRDIYARRTPKNAKLDLLTVPRAIARKSVTLLRVEPDVLPLKSTQKIAVITAEASLGQSIKRRAAATQTLTMSAYASVQKRAVLRPKAAKLAKDADVIVVGLMNSRQHEFIPLAMATGKPVIVVSLGLPYYAEQVEAARTVLAVYSYREVSTDAAAAALFGEIGTEGQLPVTLIHYPFGHHLP